MRRVLLQEARHLPGRDSTLQFNFNHDDLVNSAVTGKDSLELSQQSPEAKPAVIVSHEEFQKLKNKIPSGFIPYSSEKGVYLLNKAGLSNMGISLQEAGQMIDEGNDSALLGYPEDRNGPTSIVTRGGDVVTDPLEMALHATHGNVKWGAEGKGSDKYAARIAEAMMMGKSMKGKGRIKQ